MLPAICLTIFGLCFLLLLLIVIPIIGVACADSLKKAMNEEAENKGKEPVDSIAVVLSVAWILVALAAGLIICTHFHYRLHHFRFLIICFFVHST